MLNIPMNSTQPLSISNLSNDNIVVQKNGQQFNQQMTDNSNQFQVSNQQSFQQPAQQNFQQPVQQDFQQPMQQNFQQPAQQNFQQPMQQAPQQNFQQPVQQSFQQPMQQPMQQPAANRPSGGGVIIKKGQKTSLSQMNPNLDLIQVGIGWDLGPGGQAYDLDVEAFLLGGNEKVIGDDWFVFYNQPLSPDGAVKLLGDSTTGAGDGDDEIIQVQLSRLNNQVSKIIFIVTINEAKENGYNFSNVKNAYARIVDMSSNKELIRFNLTDYYDNVCSMMIGEVYNKNGEWRFNPIGNGTADDLIGLCARYGVNVAG